MSPLRGSIIYSTFVPTAHAVGYYYAAPFRGFCSRSESLPVIILSVKFCEAQKAEGAR